MDEIRVRELPQKGSAISLTDLIIVEDEDGTKTVEASQFKSLVQQSLFFDTVEDMKSATLNEGDIIRTLGYRSVGDGGGAYYAITYEPTAVEDGIYVHYLHTSDTLRAKYIRTENDINISQAGAFGDGVTDDFTLIQKMLDTGTLLAVPRRVYKVTGSLDVPSDTTIDLNGATIYCPNSAAFCVGLDHEAKNITIKNGKFIGINGIELYTMASEVIITNCEFYGPNRSAMSKGIFINGASNVQIDNVKIGTVDGDEVRYGIYVSNGTGEDGNQHINYNVQMSNLSIIASMAGISFSGTFIDKNISVNDFSIEGYKYRDGKEMYGVLIGSNADSISLSNAKIKNMNTAICVSGIISAVVACTDIMVDDCDIMYNFGSAGSTVHLYGIHRFTGNSDNTAYVFDRITSRLVLQGQFDGDRETGRLAGICKTSMSGSLVDVVSPIGRNKVNVTSMDQLNNSGLDNIIPGYKNVSINLEFSGTITEFTFPSLSGQVIALYSDAAECVVSQSTKLRVPSDITLSRYEPVVFRNNNGVWSMVQFGGTSDGTTGGATGGGTTGGTTITELEPLSIYGKSNTKLCTYNGSSAKDVNITPSNIGAAEAKHEHATTDIKGISNLIPKKLPNEYAMTITLNGGTTAGVDKFTYDGTSAVAINITTGGGGGSSVDLSAYGTKLNFTGSGSFSVNRKEFTEVGANSVAMGTNVTASGVGAVGIGNEVIVDAKYATALGNNTQASGEAATAKGASTIAIGKYSETSGKETVTNGESAFAMGSNTIASGNNQLVFGRYNIDDTTGDYVNIVGAGSSDSNRKNIYTLDWSGNGVYKGTVSVSTPTEDNHATTKKYVDDLNSNLDSKVLEVSNAMTILKNGLKGFGQTGYVVEDWNNIDSNGFIIGTSTPTNNGPASQEYATLMGIAIVNLESVQEMDEEGAVQTSTNISDGLVIVYSLAESFENIFEDEFATRPISFPVYMRQCIGGEWGEWYKMYIGHGDFDAISEDEEPGLEE